MVASLELDILQNGAYTLQQAALLARIHLRTVNYWFDADAARGPAVKKYIPENEDGLVSFVDLIQLLGVHAIRTKHKVSLQRIREAVRKTEDLGITYPFARNSAKTFLLGDRIVFKTDSGDFLEATGKHARAFLMEPIVLPYLKDLTFDDQGLPTEYRPMDNILLAPKRKWGAPVVESCDYTVQSLVAAVQSEGSIEDAADICGVGESEVRAALRYEDYLSGIAA
jgi:uncharacterized protein (DUF433 family)